MKPGKAHNPLHESQDTSWINQEAAVANQKLLPVISWRASKAFGRLAQPLEGPPWPSGESLWFCDPGTSWISLSTDFCIRDVCVCV